MKDFTNAGLTTKTLQILNNCRLFLQVTTLAEITNHASTHLLTESVYQNRLSPMPDANDGNQNDEVSSLQATFNLQMQKLRTIKMLLVELDTRVDLLIAAATSINHSPILSKLLPTLLPLPPMMTTICRKPGIQPHAHYPRPQFPPWPWHPVKPCNKLTPVFKFSLYKKYIPVKPPFFRSCHGNQPMIWTKDCMRLP